MNFTTKAQLQKLYKNYEKTKKLLRQAVIQLTLSPSLSFLLLGKIALGFYQSSTLEG